MWFCVIVIVCDCVCVCDCACDCVVSFSLFCYNLVFCKLFIPQTVLALRGSYL